MVSPTTRGERAVTGYSYNSEVFRDALNRTISQAYRKTDTEVALKLSSGEKLVLAGDVHVGSDVIILNTANQQRILVPLSSIVEVFVTGLSRSDD